MNCIAPASALSSTLANMNIRFVRRIPALVTMWLVPITLCAQQSLPASDPVVLRAFAAIKAGNAWTLAQQVSLCEIPAPPFKEQLRGIEFRRRLIALGYANTRIDAVGNVIAERAGSGTGPTVMIAGHLDTVFPEGTVVKVKRDGERYAAPDIHDDCRGLAVVLAVAKALTDGHIKTAGKVILVGDVGEEGQGNLRGMHQLFEHEYAGKIDAFVSVDDAGSSIVNRAVGSHRYTMRFSGPGGHSYGAFGTPSAIHAMGRAIANISDLQVPTVPKTTFTVGTVSGGTSVNSIAGNAAMDVDMRSESTDELDRLDAAVRSAVVAAVLAENARWPASTSRISVKYDTIGIRPLGRTVQTDDTPIVRTALEAARQVGLVSRTTASSTDANLPMSLGIPAITISGGGIGDGAHSLGEWYEDGPDGYKGPQWALLIVLALVGVHRS